MKSCHNCLATWQTYLNRQPELWFIRFLPDDTMWANTHARQAIGAPETQPWEAAMRWAHHEDTHRIEDIYSLALKTFSSQTLEFRLKTRPDTFSLVRNGLTPWKCNQCQHHCAIILVLAELIRPSDGSSLRPSESHGESHQ